MELLDFFGRLHPLFLHLPIGILTLAFIMEWLSRKEKYASIAPAVGLAIQIGMWSAIISSVSGYVLSLEGGYDEVILNRHQWLGIGTAVVSVAIYFLHKRKKSKTGKKFYFPLFGFLILLIGATGHLGGSLTHGSDFLMEPFSGTNKNEPVVITNMDSALVFQELIQPIFKKKCNSCHNESKLKGELLMSTIEGIQKGGENGAFFKAGNIENSLFLQRVHLPIEEKEHMPPKGKRQLTKDEIVLLEWWVKEGATFKKRVADVNQPENIEAILMKYATPDNSVFALKVEPPKESDLNKIRNSGIPIEVISKEKPFVTVSLRGRKDLDKSILRSLGSVSENLIELDLSDTNMDDNMLSYLKDFPHLQKLFLQKTEVTGKNLEVLNDMEYLEYLNFYETPLEDNALLPIAKLAGLQNLYLWKTNVSKKAISELKNKRPSLHVNTGIDKNIFGSATLKPPAINVDNEIFTDSVLVEFDINFKGVNLHYTLDGTPPDSTSKIYVEPFLITETSDIQVISFKEGWETSPPAQKVIVRAKHKTQNIKLNKKPSDKYKAEGPASLVNFKKGTVQFSEGEWIGYQKENLIANLDMGKEIDLSKVSISALESTGSWIFFPKEIKISVSKNGKQYTPIGEKSIPTASGPEEPSTKIFTVGFETQKARYVKVEVKSNLVNPKWHPAPGEGCWLFVDEIMVE